MFTFDMIKTYEGGWTLDKANTAPLAASQLALVDHAVVSRSEEYGTLQVTIYYKSGGHSYIGLSRDSKLGVDDAVDMSRGVIQRLIRGNEECWKYLEN